MIQAPVIFAMLAAGLLKLAAHYAFPAGMLQAETAGLSTYLEVLGSIYGIVSAFTLFIVWGQFYDVQRGIAQEAAALEDLVRIGSFLSDKEPFHGIRKSARDYLTNMANDERKALGHGQMSVFSEECFAVLCRQVRDITLQDGRDTVIYDQMLGTLERVSESRDQRLSASVTRIPFTLWRLLMFSSVALFAGFLLLGFTNVFVGVAVNAGIAGCLAFLLTVISDMDNPFVGFWCVSYAQTTAIQTRIGQI